MPVQPISTTTIRSQLDAAVNDGTLTNQEATSIISQMKTDGVSKYEANEVLEALRSLVGSDGGTSRQTLIAARDSGCRFR